MKYFINTLLIKYIFLKLQYIFLKRADWNGVIMGA